MADPVAPVFRTAGEVTLIGTMAIYGSQAEASRGIPLQWRAFRQNHPALASRSGLCGASPCTDDHKIHYLAGVVHDDMDNAPGLERLTLAAGEYAVFRVDDRAQLRETWIWLFSTWLPASGRREKHAPEFERFTGISEDGNPVGPVEIWIPLEPTRA